MKLNDSCLCSVQFPVQQVRHPPFKQITAMRFGVIAEGNDEEDLAFEVQDSPP
jgi:hypothetical protein